MNLRNYSSGFLRRQQKLTKTSTCFDINIKHYNKEERKTRQIIKRQFSFFSDEELPGLKIQKKNIVKSQKNSSKWRGDNIIHSVGTTMKATF